MKLMQSTNSSDKTKEKRSCTYCATAIVKNVRVKEQASHCTFSCAETKSGTSTVKAGTPPCNVAMRTGTSFSDVTVGPDCPFIFSNPSKILSFNEVQTDTFPHLQVEADHKGNESAPEAIATLLDVNADETNTQDRTGAQATARGCQNEEGINSQDASDDHRPSSRRNRHTTSINSKPLLLLQSNVDVLTSKKEEFMVQIDILKPDVICLQEVLPKNYIDPIIPEIELKVDSYELYSANTMKRGTITYVSGKLTSMQVDTPNIRDVVTCKIYGISPLPLLVCNVYRSPRSDAEEDTHIHNHISEILQEPSCGSIICGDFNHPGVDWDSYSSPNPVSRVFLDCIQENFLTQHVCENTRIREGQCDSLQDLILTDKESLVSNLKLMPPIGRSDHMTLLYNVDFVNGQPDTRRTMNFYRGDYIQMRTELSAIDWTDTLDEEDINNIWTTFEGIINEAMNRNIPLKSSRPRKKAWLTREASDAVNEKRRLYNRYRKHKTPESLEAYKRAKNQATTVTRNARKDYEQSVARSISDNPKEFWSYVKQETRSSNTIAPIKRADGSLATEPEEKAQLLNSFFASVFTKENLNQKPDMADQHPPNTLLNDIEFGREEIENEVKKLKSGKSAGPDNIHPRVLKETISVISAPLALIFNKSMQVGQLPDAWKAATVVPIYKKGPKGDPGNYRPISLTSVCCKLMERLIRRKLLEFLNDNNYFCNAQHGFRPRRSCITQLLTVVEQWTEWLDGGIQFDCIYLDYKKAFDSVPHRRLMEKVRASGITGNVWEWVCSFLSGRKQRVRVESSLSSWADVTSGIPQGSVLGPTLFLIFINDLPEIVQNHCALFADDTKIYAPTQKSTTLQADLDAMNTWTTTWQLPFNRSKCKVIHFGRNNPSNNYTLGNHPITAVEEEKDLGVTFDPLLTFSKHHDKAIAKANSRLGLIKRTFKHLDKTSFILLYKSLVRPILEYGQVVTHPLRKQDEDRLEKVQRRATKLVNGLQDKPYINIDSKN